MDRVLARISYGLRDAATAVATNRTPPSTSKTLVPKIAPRPLLLIADPESDNGEKLNRRLLSRPRASRRRCGRSRTPATSTASSTHAAEYERRVVELLRPGPLTTNARGTNVPRAPA